MLKPVIRVNVPICEGRTWRGGIAAEGWGAIHLADIGVNNLLGHRAGNLPPVSAQICTKGSVGQIEVSGNLGAAGLSLLTW